MKYNNTVIKVLNKEHGKKVIEWWKKQGVDTSDYGGLITEADGGLTFYYGVFDDWFNNFSLEFVIKNKIKIIQLPSETEYPKLMWVSDDIEFFHKYKRVVFMEKCGRFIAWSSTSENVEKVSNCSTWEYAKDIEEEVVEEIVELTLEDITNGKGVGVPTHLLRIKK